MREPSLYRRKGRFAPGQSDPPVCKRCNEPHWPFKRCSNVAEVKENTPEWERAHREGWSEWGDRLPSYQRMGSNLVRRSRETVGNVTPHPDWGWNRSDAGS